MVLGETHLKASAVARNTDEELSVAEILISVRSHSYFSRCFGFIGFPYSYLMHDARVAVAEWLARRLMNLLFTGSNTGGATWSTRNNLE